MGAQAEQAVGFAISPRPVSACSLAVTFGGGVVVAVDRVVRQARKLPVGEVAQRAGARGCDANAVKPVRRA